VGDRQKEKRKIERLRKEGMYVPYLRPCEKERIKKEEREGGQGSMLAQQ